MAQQQNVRGVAVDGDARRVGDPVTVVVWPSGMEQDADTWSDASNYISAGAGVKDGYPSGPEATLNEDSSPAPGNEPPESQHSRPAPTPAPARPAPQQATAQPS